MNKKLAIVATIFITCTIIINNDLTKKENNMKSEVPIVRKKQNLLSFYIENENGDYELSSGENWPTDGYIFNSDMSKCENGSELSWDDTKNAILMTGNLSDKCYVYFDKLVLPIITASVTESTDSSITITVTPTKETFDIIRYFYSIDNGATFIESTNNTYTFNNLTSNTTYNIAIYVKDANEHTSSIYSLTSKTEEIIKPIINSVTVVNTDWQGNVTLNIQYTSKYPISLTYVKGYSFYYDQTSEYTVHTSYSGNEFTYEIYPSSIGLCNGGNFNFTVYIVDSNGNLSDTFTTSTVSVTCFPAGTKVYTKDGYKNIEEIKIDDFVFSYNETTKKVELNKVTNVFIHRDVEIYNLYIGKEIIRVTPHHRFYVLKNNIYEWIAAKDLNTSYKLFDSNKNSITINKIDHIKENNIVYNFEVDNNHTYFVTKSNILVHNAKGC